MTAMRIYGLIWLLVLGLTGVSYLMDFINEMTFPIFGFVFSTLAVGGFVAALPAWLNEHYSPKTYAAAKKTMMRGGFESEARTHLSVATHVP